MVPRPTPDFLVLEVLKPGARPVHENDPSSSSFPVGQVEAAAARMHERAVTVGRLSPGELGLAGQEEAAAFANQASRRVWLLLMCVPVILVNLPVELGAPPLEGLGPALQGV